jgi:bacterial leucyl aminopeptidase
VSESGISVVFFDLGDTLGTAVVSQPPLVHLTAFQVFPFVPDLLEGLKARGLRLGIISNTGAEPGKAVDEVLRRAGILKHFTKALRIYSADVGLTKDTPQIFRLSAERAGLAADPGLCLFVGENAAERANAQAAGMVVCPDPRKVESLLTANEIGELHGNQA